MQLTREGFTASDNTMGPQQSEGLDGGGVSMDSGAVGSDNAALNVPQNVNGAPGSIAFGNAGSSPERVGNSIPWGR